MSSQGKANIPIGSAIQHHMMGFRVFRDLGYVRCSVPGKGTRMVITVEISPLNGNPAPLSAGDSLVKWWDNNRHLEDCLSKVIQRYVPDLTTCTVIRVDGKGNCLP